MFRNIRWHKIFVMMAVLAIAVFAHSDNSVISANPSASTNVGDASLRQGIPLLFEFHKLTTGDKQQRFAYPQRNLNFRENQMNVVSGTLPFLGAYGLNISMNSGMFCATTPIDPVANSNPAIKRDTIFPGFFGAVSTSGFIDSLDFDFNAAFFAERHSQDSPYTFDRQETGWVLWDDEEASFINYTRWQGHVGLNYAWARVEVGRDAMHWGPGFYNNLTLNRGSVPYDYFSSSMTFGPLRVISFYSRLDIDSVGAKFHSHDDRNFYGHRYELAFDDFTIGVNEIQAIFNENNVMLFVPIIPLFMEKGNYSERSNNGALSFDLNYRIMNVARIYTEFFLDDLESPIAILKNENMNSEWAWMVGMQVGRNMSMFGRILELGTIAEYARIEQVVYTHYKKYDSRFANKGFPLGNQSGPNSQNVDWTLYALWNDILYLTVHNNWSWKGTVPGSNLSEDSSPLFIHAKKDFLGGAKMRYMVMPSAGYSNRYFDISVGFTCFDEKQAQISLRWNVW